MSEHQVCPWCQMEIVWDEEIGPEPACPHCYNELTDYRTVAIPAKQADAFPLGDDSDSGWSRYARAAERYIDAQQEAVECPDCREFMVLAGEQLVPEHVFVPSASVAGLPPFLKPPFKLEVLVCSHCFAVRQRLSGKDRSALVRRLGNV